MKDLTKEEFVLVLRRHSSGLSRGSSRNRVEVQQACGRLGAQMGEGFGNK